MPVAHVREGVWDRAAAVQGGTRTYQLPVTPPPRANTHSHKAVQAWRPRSPQLSGVSATLCSPQRKQWQSYKTKCKETTDGLTVSLWDAGGTDVRFLCEGILLFIHPNIKTEEYEWVFALGTWTQMPSQSPITAGQQTRSMSRLTDQSTQQQDEQARIISDMHGKTIFLSISSICYTIKRIWIVTPVNFFIRWALFHGRCAYRGIWAHGIVWHVARKAFFQPDRRSERCWTGSRSQPSPTVLFHSQISVYIKNPLIRSGYMKLIFAVQFMLY